jgi:hypothetical protein
MRPRHPVVPAFALLAMLALGALLGGCRPGAEAPAAAGGDDADNRLPVQAVLLHTRHLRDNDLAGFARDAVPPELYDRLPQRWRAGRSRWPLQALPFEDRLPELLAALAADGAEARLQAGFDSQFAGADAEIRAAAEALAVFGVRYLESDAGYSAAEREHYAQVVAALGRWATKAPLADRARARSAITRLSRAARATGLHSAGSFADAGMEPALRRLGAFLGTAKAVLRDYGLDLDGSLDSVQATLHDQTGDTARVRMQYVLAGTPVDTLVELERVDGRWYLGEYLRHAREAAGAGAPRQAGDPGALGHNAADAHATAPVRTGS